MKSVLSEEKCNRASTQSRGKMLKRLLIQTQVSSRWEQYYNYILSAIMKQIQIDEKGHKIQNRMIIADESEAATDEGRHAPIFYY